MVKRILLFILLILVSAYLIVAVTMLSRDQSEIVCGDVQLVIRNSVYADFITQKEVKHRLEEKGLSPIGKPLIEINTQTIEDELNKHVLINNVECYKTPSGVIKVEVSQRIPILRVMAANGEDYYIDTEGKVMPLDARCVARLPIVTGMVEKSFAMKDIYKFALFLQKNSFWNAQIEQIHVLPFKRIELVPRVGDHIISLGKLNGYERKLERLKRFYEEALNKVGWNKYSRISVEFDNQIVCTKRELKK